MPGAANNTLRIGVLGAAAIARDFVTAVKASTRVEVVAIASRDADKARQFASDFGLPRAHSSYEALLTDDGIDAIYVPLPNSMHCEWAIRALQAGKHVLCEKPLAVSATQAREMFEVAERFKRLLVEGYPYLAQPYTARLRKLIGEGAIGSLKVIQAFFGFTVSELSTIRLDPAMGGGALLDAGCYPISLIRMLAGARPSRVDAVAHWGNTGVDRTLVATLEFPSGLLAQMSCSFETPIHRHALIVGDSGTCDTTFFNHTDANRPAQFQLKRGKTWSSTTELITTESTNGFLAESEAFAALIAGNRAAWPGPHAAESIDIALTLDAIAHSAKHRVPVDLPAA